MSRIERISVKNLFRNFNHSIEMHLDERVTIIHGPNGVGKTTLLRLINSLFNSNYYILGTVYFREFRIDFDDGYSFIVSKPARERRSKSYELKFTLLFGGSEIEQSTQEYIPSEELESFFWYLERSVSGLIRIDELVWRYIPTEEIMNLEDVIEQFGQKFPFNEMKNIKKEPIWLKDIKNKTSILFIEAQRLIHIPVNRKSREYSFQSSFSESQTISPSMISAVTVYSRDLITHIKGSLANYASLSQSLDRTFPSRIVAQDIKPNLTANDLYIKLASLEEKRTRLIDAGLLDKEGDINFQVPQRIDDDKLSLLSVYVNDVEQKLSVFDDIASRIDLLKKFINNRFKYKKITINKSKGFEIVNSDNTIIPATELSSGEQHQLVLMYSLLFNTKKNSLILIDEPELSLHVGWQMQFLKDLHSIVEISEFDVLIATHSPQIIHDRWDLTVELGELYNEKSIRRKFHSK